MESLARLARGDPPLESDPSTPVCDRNSEWGRSHVHDQRRSHSQRFERLASPNAVDNAGGNAAVVDSVSGTAESAPLSTGGRVVRSHYRPSLLAVVCSLGLLVASAQTAMARSAGDAARVTSSTSHWPTSDSGRPSAGQWLSVSAGSYHTCGIRTGGYLWCWGDNADGQLGDGTRTRRLSPVRVAGGGTWATVAAGDEHTCGVQTDGTLWCWGSGPLLGDGTNRSHARPVEVGTDRDWTAVSAAYDHTCGTRTDGTVWCWGTNSFGQLGDGTTTERLSPVQAGGTTTWTGVSTGIYSTCGSQSDGTIWCWGSNDYGQLGDGTTVDQLMPEQVGSDVDWAAVSMGDWHACGVRTDGTVWCWGFNRYGQLGDGGRTDQLAPEQVGGRGHQLGRRQGGER